MTETINTNKTVIPTFSSDASQGTLITASAPFHDLTIYPTVGERADKQRQKPSRRRIKNVLSPLQGDGTLSSVLATGQTDSKQPHTMSQDTETPNPITAMQVQSGEFTNHFSQQTSLLMNTSQTDRWTQVIYPKLAQQENSLRLYIRSRLRSIGDEAVEDILQHVRIQAQAAQDTLDEKGLLTWARRVATNKCIDELRRRRVARFSELETDANGFSPIDLLPATVGDPHEVAEQHMLEEQIQTALQSVPETYRRIVALRYQSQFTLSFKEISNMLGIPEGTVKSYFHRGIQFMREPLSHLREPESI